MAATKQSSGNLKKAPAVKSGFRIRSIVKPVVIILAVVLVVAQLALDVFIIQKAIPNADNQATLVQLISSAVENSSRPVDVQAESGKQYISELRLVLPATTDYSLSPLRYTYVPAVGDIPQAVNVTSLGLIKRSEAALLAASQPNPFYVRSSSEAVFKEVPSLQACARGVYIFFGPNDAKNYSPGVLAYRGDVKLQDGRTLYMYTEQPNACKKSSFGSLVEYLKQAQSY